MTNKILIKRSAVAGKIPVTADLDLAELAVNSTDGVLYTRKGNSVIEIGANQFSGDVTGSNSKGVGVLTLAASGVTPGTYGSVTVDAKGRVTNGSTSTATILQVVTGAISSYSGTTKLPINASPTITAGTQIWSQNITITSGTRVLLKCQLFADSSNNNNDVVAAFFRGNTLVGVVPMSVISSGIPSAVSYMDYDYGVTAGTTYTYSCRVGGTANGTWYINQDECGNKWGNAYQNSYSLTEIT